MMLVGLLIGFFGRAVYIERLGPLPLPSPVSMLVFVAAIWGIAAAIAVVGPSLPAVNPPRVQIMRAATGLLWWLVAIVCAMLTAASEGVIVQAAVARNVLLFVAIATIMVALGAVQLSWLPVTLLVVCSLQFGWRPHGTSPIRWWAVAVNENSTARQWFVIGSIAALALTLLALLRPIDRMTLGRRRGV
ncbi:hypothetical protein SAMN06309944_1940 [Micrococcales bacterium KH10]|nr:hypothetical protein SAMN06309944_1940 [Micrococcales bacterium KH10]